METVLENSIPGLSDSIAKIREDVKSGVGNLTEVCVSTMADVTRLLMKSFFPTTKIVGTLGPNSRSVQVISACLTAGMSVAQFDFSWGSPYYHQETLENLKMAVKSTKKLCAVMLNTAGPEMLVVTKVLKKGDTLFLGQYLFTGSETSVWLELCLLGIYHVFEVKGDEVGCVVKNSATLVGTMYTLHAAEIHIDLPTLTEKDKHYMIVKNKIDFLSLSHARYVEDVREARQFLSKLGDLNQTQIFAKIESVFLFQKTALYRCNMAGKPTVLTRVVDSMTNNLRPTGAVATDVANAVLDGDDAIILGAETLHGLHPVETVSTVSRICAEVRLRSQLPQLVDLRYKFVLEKRTDPPKWDLLKPVPFDIDARPLETILGLENHVCLTFEHEARPFEFSQLGQVECVELPQYQNLCGELFTFGLTKTRLASPLEFSRLGQVECVGLPQYQNLCGELFTLGLTKIRPASPLEFCRLGQVACIVLPQYQNLCGELFTVGLIKTRPVLPLEFN
ncbi:pyruvate kinase 1, cytosolic [Cucumis melo var. makuwa]|uniref:pyruvate kinase n=1 Tax=Cucumis melo var. makuwa TaxID=1194695 RepID=A0A5A7TYA8_CUCMM|nr:pyruvate kinase 1, cytosolic [Cucumis melo var. makuwa]